MSDTPRADVRLLRLLTCTVCQNIYNQDSRLPTLLGCKHTFCEICVDDLMSSSPIICPTCKRTCDADKVQPNCALVDEVKELCPACTVRVKSTECLHCELSLCHQCVKSHAVTFQADIRKKVKQIVDEVRKEAKNRSDITIDESPRKDQLKKAEYTIKCIEAALNHHRDEVNKLEMMLKAEVNKRKQANISRFENWQKKHAAELKKCESFTITSDQKLESQNTEDCSVTAMRAIHMEALDFLSKAKMSPELTEYHFVATKSEPDVGAVVDEPKTSVDTCYTRERGFTLAAISHPEDIYLHTGPASGKGESMDQLYENMPEEVLVAKALYTYKAKHGDDISFAAGDLITDVVQSDGGWWRGVAPDGTKGTFPANHVEVSPG